MQDSFREIPIADLCTRVTSGSTPLRSRAEFYDGGTIDWFKTGELNDWYLESSAERVTSLALASTSLKVFPAETVVMARLSSEEALRLDGLPSIIVDGLQDQLAASQALNRSFSSASLSTQNSNDEPSALVRFSGAVGRCGPITVVPSLKISSSSIADLRAGP